MKIKTKKALIIFICLFGILMPYFIIFLKSDYITSRIPDWNTTIYSFNLMGEMIKLSLLFITLILYRKLSYFQKEMKIKFFILHVILTVPSILISRFPFSHFVEIENLNMFVILINLLFVMGQILFILYYYKIWKSNNFKIKASVNRVLLWLGFSGISILFTNLLAEIGAFEISNYIKNQPNKRAVLRDLNRE